MSDLVQQLFATALAIQDGHPADNVPPWYDKEAEQILALLERKGVELRLRETA